MGIPPSEVGVVAAELVAPVAEGAPTAATAIMPWLPEVLIEVSLSMSSVSGASSFFSMSSNS